MNRLTNFLVTKCFFFWCAFLEFQDTATLASLFWYCSTESENPCVWGTPSTMAIFTTDGMCIPVYIQQDATLHSLFISGNFCTCFGWYLHPSSGAHTTVSTASGICHTVTAISRCRSLTLYSALRARARAHTHTHTHSLSLARARLDKYAATRPN